MASARINAARGQAQAARLLFIRTDRLGETLLNLPAVAALKAALPEAFVTWLVHRELEPLLASIPWIDRVHVHRSGSRALWWTRALQLGWRLRRQAFDVAVISNPMRELHAAVWLAGIPRRVGYNRKWGWLLTDRLEDRKALGERHEAEYNLDLIRALGLPTTVPPVELPRFEREQAEVLEVMARQCVHASEPFIAIHPWTSNPLKQWPPARFRELICRAGERRREAVVVIGGREEAARAGEVLMPGTRAVNLVGQLTLTQLAALLQRARILVSNDSGPVHLAAAVQTKTLVLFGAPTAATGPRRWGPWGEGHVVIWKPAMEAITVDEVFTALERQLA